MTQMTQIQNGSRRRAMREEKTRWLAALRAAGPVMQPRK
jgi:hypothetical protein